MVECWIDPNDDYLMNDQKRDYDYLARPFFAIIMATCCVSIVVCSYALLKRWKDGQKMNDCDSVEIGMNYNAI